MTSGDPKQHNSQVQINKQTKVTSLKKAAPQTVATLLVLKETLRPLLPLGMTWLQPSLFSNRNVWMYVHPLIMIASSFWSK